MVYQMAKKSSLPTLATVILFYLRKRHGVNILANPKDSVKGISNISTPGIFNAVLTCGAIDGTEPTMIDVEGRLRLLGDFALGRGCRLDIGPQATVTIGHGTYINPHSQCVIKHALTIGEHCAISWECQFLDEDFHVLTYDGRKTTGTNAISIGDRVWIGSRVSVYKGTVIPDGCVIASNSVVKGVFTEKNSLIAGNPARVIKNNVKWT